VKIDFEKADDKGSDNVKELLAEMQKMRNEITQLKSGYNNLKQNVNELNAFKDIFAESTIKFEKTKGLAEVVMKEKRFLQEYYNGFINEFSIGFTAAQAIESGVIKFSGDGNTLVSILSKAVSFIPIFGDKIAGAVDYLNEAIPTKELEQRSGNVSKFGGNST